MQEVTLAVVIPYLSRVTTVLRFTLDFYTECINTNTVDLIFEIDGSKAHMITHYIPPCVKGPSARTPDT